MKTKKWLSVLLAGAMVFGLAAPVKAEDTATKYSVETKEYYSVETITCYDENGDPIIEGYGWTGPIYKTEKNVVPLSVDIVTNPNGGATLGMVHGVTNILEVVDGNFTYAFKDMNKNGELDTYEDWRLTVEERAEALAKDLVDTEDVEFTLSDGTVVNVPKGITQIAGMMLFSSHEQDSSAGLTEAQKTYLTESYVRNITDAAGNNVTDAVGWTNAMQAFVEASDFNVPVNFASDPRSTAGSGDVYSEFTSGSGSSDISGWPSNLGMAATFSEEHMYNFAIATSEEYRALGIATALGPQIDLATEPRWLRVGGTFGEDYKLTTMLTQAYVDGSQSTYDENGNDLGWGEDSINCMIKHFPGDGIGEGGRESHTQAGKYGVYPGNNLETHLIPFVEGGMKLKGKTGSTAAVMTSYSIGVDAEGNALGGEAQGTAYSSYKMNILREELGFDGAVCTDWGVTTCDTDPGAFIATGWGAESLSVDERHLEIIEAGTDMFGGNNDNKPVVYAYTELVKENGKEAANARFAETAKRLVTLTMQIGMFENPYNDKDESLERAGSEDKIKAGYEAQLDSVVMLKNTNNAIVPEDDAAKDPKDMTVYVPKSVDGSHYSFWAFGNVPASVQERINMSVVKNVYGTVLTDEIEIVKNDDGTYTYNVTRPTEEQLKTVDKVIVGMSSPNNGDNFSGAGMTKTADGREFYPLSLQYATYTADSDSVRKESISMGVDGENRSYYGASNTVINSYDLESCLGAVEAVRDAGNNCPVVAYINANNGFSTYEFEDKVDAIVVGFSVSDAVVLEVINGGHEPQGLLPIQVPANMETVEANLEDVAGDLDVYVDSEGHAYDFAYGMDWDGVINDERVKTYAYAYRNVLTGTQEIDVVGYEWGPAVTKTTLKLDQVVDADSVSVEDFKVVETKNMTNWGQNPDVGFGAEYVGSAERQVIAAYTSDKDGNRSEDSEYVTIEMYVSPNDGSPFRYDLWSGYNNWCDPYELEITIVNGQSLSVGGVKYKTLDVEATPVAKDLGLADLYEEDYFTYEDTTYSYAHYSPAEDDGTNPLIIWLHGAGEGGTDTTIITLGNEATALVDEEIQTIMEGAYVLAPQSPTMWMDDGTGQYTQDGTTKYTEALMALIENYVKNNPDVDTNRIYIGGCSNGGFMTMEMVLAYPDYFAAAYPICEAYSDAWISDEKLANITEMPIWFTHALTDTTVNPETTTLATFDRLVNAGATNVHKTIWDSVLDTSGNYTNADGSPYEYNGHWSWLYVFNNECEENGVTIWEWMAQQSKSVETTPTPTSDNTPIVLFASMAVIAACAYITLRKKEF